MSRRRERASSARPGEAAPIEGETAASPECGEPRAARDRAGRSSPATGAPHDGLRPVGAPGISWSGRGRPTATPRPTEPGSPLPATFRRRLAGLGIDLACTWALGTTLLLFSSLVYVVSSGTPAAEPISDEDALSVTIAWWTLFLPTWFGFTLWFNVRGQTIGKRLLGLRIVDRRGRPPGIGRGLRRTFGAWISWGALGFGFFSAAWEPSGQTWHDKLAGTYVVRVDRVAVEQVGIE